MSIFHVVYVMLCARLLCPCHVLSSQESHFPASAFTARPTNWHCCWEFSWKILEAVVKTELVVVSDVVVKL